MSTWVSVTVASILARIIAVTQLLPEICYRMVQAMTEPRSFPGGPRENLIKKRRGKRKVYSSDTPSMKNWVLVTDDNSINLGQYPAEITGSSAGRMVWKHVDDKDMTQEIKENAIFLPSKNINSGDLVYRQAATRRKSHVTNQAPSTDPLEASRRGVAFYEQLQCDDGYWPGDYGGSIFLLPGVVLSCYSTGIDLGEARKLAIQTYFLNHQQEDGGWGTHIEGDSTMFGTTLSYVALRLLGLPSTHPVIVNARSFLRKHEGAIRAPSWARFSLCCVGLFEWKGINPIPAELWLLPNWFPFHPGRLWCHSRLVYLPMSYLYSVRFEPEITPLIRELRKEIFVEDYDSIDWDSVRVTPCCDLDMYSPPSLIMRILNRILSCYELAPIQWLRKRATEFALEYIRAEDSQTCYVCIGPVNKVLNMLCAYCADPKGKALRRHADRLVDYLWVAEDGMKMQGYNGSQMWDTSFATLAIVEAGLASEFCVCMDRANEFMRATQVKKNPEQMDRFYRHISKGGWAFSTSPHGWPISDVTGQGLQATLHLRALGIVSNPIDDQSVMNAVDVVLSLQNDDGGWATYENTRGWRWYELLNPSEVFGDIMIDYSYVECSSSCLSALRAFSDMFSNYRCVDISRSIAAGERFIRSIQRKDGSWYGSWAVCFTYGTWFAIEGLRACGINGSDDAICRACEFLLSKQRDDGGWSESYLSSVNKVYTEEEDYGSMVIQTSWALLGLMKGQSKSHEAIERGIKFLMSKQLPSGDWDQEGIAGVFNRNCFITYTAYRNVFPIWALGYYSQHYIQQDKRLA